VPFSAEAFTAVVRDGVLRDNGMAAYSDLTPEQIADIRHYIRTAAHAARAAEGASAR
jgi:mono/diheme cytochrome c family protein